MSTKPETTPRPKIKWGHHPAFLDKQLTLGERAADRVRNGMGSWPFVFVFLGSMAVWAFVNTIIKIGASDGKRASTHTRTFSSTCSCRWSPASKARSC